MIMNSLFNITDVYAENIAENFCSDFSSTMQLISVLLLIARVCVPILIIIFGTKDLFNVITNGKSDDLSKQIKIFGTRVLIGVVVFFIPTFIRVVVNAVDSDQKDYKVCVSCLENPLNCEGNE